MPTPDPVLRVAALGKDYAAPVLSDVELSLHAGEVLALTGENGAGKSTCSKIVAGLVRPTRGTMILQGGPYAPSGRTEAEALGVKMVTQELNLLPTLSVAENLFLGRLPHRLGWIDRGRLRAEARRAMARVGLEAIDPDTPVGGLGVGFRQMVEIARSLIGDCRVLILDEPTASLTGREVDLLFVQISRLKREGVAVIYISHRLDELKRVADRVAVLRDGRLVAVEAMASVTADQVVGLMVGRALAQGPDLGRRAIGAPVLRVTGLTRGEAVRDVSLTAHRGEILGISGLIGAGRTELLRLIYGADRADGGTVEVGDPLAPARIRTPADAVRQGVAMISEDRKGEGLLLQHSIAANLTLGNMARVSRRGIIDAVAEAALAERRIASLDVRCAGPDQPVEALSGGNQQKVVIGRALERDYSVFLFDEPTRGIDVGAKADIYALLGRLAAAGKAIVVVSSDLRELMQISDRIAVMLGGRMVRTFGRAEWSEDALLAAAFSGYVQRDAVFGVMIRPPTQGLGSYAALAWALAAMIALFSLLSPHFLTFDTFRAIANQIPDLTVLAVGMTFVLIVGGIDLSIGSVLALAASVTAVGLLGWQIGPVPAAMAGLAVGGMMGALTGLVTTAWRIPSFIVSLGMLEIARGLAYHLTDSRTAYIGDVYGALADPIALGVSPAFLIALAVIVAGQAILTRTVFGRNVVAVGTNEEAVRLAGVDPRPFKVAVFAAMGLLAGLAALFQVSRLEAADPNAGVGMELQVIAAVVIGGASLMGGRGSVIASFFGVLIIAVLEAGLAQVGATEPTKRVITGAVIVVAVVLDTYRSHRAGRR